MYYTAAMEQRIIDIISDKTGISAKTVLSVTNLLDDGATIPFIARYRKEVTGGLDEEQLRQLRDAREYTERLESRRETVLQSIEEQGKLTGELKQQVLSAATLTDLEDIYLPYRPKRKTRGVKAKEKGLEPLALWLWNQEKGDPSEKAAEYVSKETGGEEVGGEETGVKDTSEALQGAEDIIAEWVSENSDVRSEIRSFFKQKGLITSSVVKSKENEAEKYKDYFDCREDAAKAPSHRVLAMLRGAKEGYLKVHIAPPREKAVEMIQERFIKNNTPAAGHVAKAIEDGYKRLIEPSLETEYTAELKEKADQEAIRIFVSNLRELLMSAPLGEKNVMAIDPGFRTGCKLVCLDAQGTLLHNNTIYPVPPHNKKEKAAEIVTSLVKQYNIQAIAVGNGTAGRETQSFLEKLGLDTPVVMVDESGASVYSASVTARMEFPDYDVTVRGAVSIGRRLMDPLAELVKIDPKSIGVGQYQHDVDQKLLKKSLEDVVVSCVNSVGVDINRASRELLSYVAGLNKRMAGKLIDYRAAKGRFDSRKELIDVPGMGEKTFQQCAGFLRIHEGKNPLDASAVHPESYNLVESIAESYNCSLTDLMQKEEIRRNIDWKSFVTETVGMPTLKDIQTELEKPGRDPREEFELFRFSEQVQTIDDLKEGMVLPGIVTNVAAFGAFVDIGVHNDGLVHISQIADHFVKNIHDEVKVKQQVQVRVVSIDKSRGRIGLSMKQGE